MAHLLAYYKELTQRDGRIVRLEIYRKQTTSASWVAKEIGPVIQALHLDIQGQSGDIDAPIIKTSLVMTFDDAPDHQEATVKKCGSWEEFYTSDSTYWKVLLLAHDKDEQEFRQIWGGYVTPDSFSEQLCYRGLVTIVARDNIGHMQDFPFDAQGNEDGMITLQELVNAAWTKIESPMTLDWRGEEDSAEWLESEGVAAPFTSMNVSAFKEMNWYDAVEKALYSYGIVMRYIGNNRVQMASLRYMPYHGRASIDSVKHVAPMFVAVAERELAPAARRIEETVSYKLTDGKQVPLKTEFSGAVGECPFLSKNVFGEISTYQIPVWPSANTGDTGWGNVPSSTLFFNPQAYTMADEELRENAGRMLWLAANTDGSRSVWYGASITAANISFKLGLGDAIERTDANTVTTAYGLVEGGGIGRIRAKKVRCAIVAKQYGITEFYDGMGWSADYADFEIPVEDSRIAIDVNMKAYSGNVTVQFFIIDIVTNGEWDSTRGLGYYVPVTSMNIGVSDGSSLLSTNRVNTIFNNDNNVIISRDPALAPAYNNVALPDVICNGIFVKKNGIYQPARAWNWTFYASTLQQMAVYNHLQLLCFHGKPNNVITGTVVNGDIVNPFSIYVYNGVEHMLVSGSCNFLNGMIESAILREFARYEDMWGDVAGDSMPATEQESSTNVEEGGSSSGSSATYENTTNVTIGGSGGGSVTVDTFLSDTSVNPVQNKAIKAYVDSADKVLADGIENINDKVSAIKQVTVDSSMSSASTNPVQNKVIKAYIDQFVYDVDYYAGVSDDYATINVDKRDVGGKKSIGLGVGLTLQNDIENAAEDDLDNGIFNNGLVTALAVKQYVENALKQLSCGVSNLQIDFTALNELVGRSPLIMDSEVASAGLTSEVIANILTATYNKVVDVNVLDVWNYTAFKSEDNIQIQFMQGDGYDIYSSYSLWRNPTSGYWTIIYKEI